MRKDAVYVFDTNIFVAALRSRRGASFIILNAILRGLISGAVSQALILEYEEVLTRDANIENFWADTDEVETVIGALANQFEFVQVSFTWRPQLRDPDDEMVLDCAVNASASAIVTFNKKDFLPNAVKFGIEILSPGEFVKRFLLKERLNP